MRRGTEWRVIATLAVVGLFAVALASLPINLGLDLRGGVHVVLQAQPEPGHPITRDIMDRARSVLEQRVNGLGVAEPVIQLKGTDQVVVDLPGIKDTRQAVEVLGQTAVLEFKDPDGKTIFKGDQLADAMLSADQFGRPAVSFKLKPEGARKFAQMTSANVGRQAPIVLDGKVISDPVIQTAITGGDGQITGNFSMDEAKRLVTLLRAGALPVPLKVVENRSVGPSLGKDAVDSGIRAGILGLVLVILYMIFYYRLPGFVADVALLLYGVMVLGAMAAVHATLTLPGIAGFILSLGMAVDANVLIFERVKEELRSGKRLRAAIDAGFDRALPSILDSNITTLLAAGVLFYFGTGSIRGFAVTLGIGVILSMFSAITVTKVFLNLIVDRDPDRYVRLFGFEPVTARPKEAR
ncbi:MAG: protein translocase subunit SecD [Firmicutes bacterium]|nr:protein translocase subunit SecD [Bacillota bacterium]